MRELAWHSRVCPKPGKRVSRTWKGTEHARRECMAVRFRVPGCAVGAAVAAVSQAPGLLPEAQGGPLHISCVNKAPASLC